MTLPKNYKRHPIFLFSLFFLIMFGLDILMELTEDEFNIEEPLLQALFFAVFMTLYYKLFARIMVPVHFDDSLYDKVLEALKERGAILLKEKGEKKYYKIKDRPWWNNRIRVKKTGLYTCLEVPENLKEEYTALVKGLRQ